MINLIPAITPAFLKMGFFGGTGTGKTFTAAKVLSQFIAKYLPDCQLAMFDTEPSGGYIAPMVKKITGKELLTIQSRSFSDLLEFTDLCIKNKFIGLIDSITHPWRTLCADYLDAKKSRVRGANGNPETVRLSLKDWGPLKEIWGGFSEKFAFSPAHFCICGREGDVWETVTDEEGKEEMQKTGVKMKTETETGFEPSLLVQMKFEYEKPDIDFFMPHISALNIGGATTQKSEGKKIFGNESGPNWETLKKERDAVLENIKDDILLIYPGQSTEDKKGKVGLLRSTFGTSSWTELENDDKKFNIKILKEGREKIQQFSKDKK
jgi:hypothetical protein